MEAEDGVMCGFAVLAVALLALIIWAAIHEAREWEQFSVAHHCKVVGRMTGDVLPTTVIGSDGKVGFGVTSTPDKTGYACDDGVTYWR